MKLNPNYLNKERKVKSTMSKTNYPSSLGSGVFIRIIYMAIEECANNVPINRVCWQHVNSLMELPCGSLVRSPCSP